MTTPTTRKPRLDRETRERIVLETAARLFYARGVHEVGMDELVRETGLGKATVYRLFASKDALVAAYLERLSAQILELMTLDLAAENPREGMMRVVEAVERDVARSDFRGCAFNNASIEYDDPAHPAREVARRHRERLRDAFVTAVGRFDPGRADAIGGAVALVIDGMYVSGAHLGPHGPAAYGRTLIEGIIGASDPV